MGWRGDAFDRQGSSDGGRRAMTQQHCEQKGNVRLGSNSMKASRRRGLTAWVGRRRLRLRNLQMVTVFGGCHTQF
jgi:hypothetical protein